MVLMQITWKKLLQVQSEDHHRTLELTPNGIDYQFQSTNFDLYYQTVTKLGLQKTQLIIRWWSVLLRSRCWATKWNDLCWHSKQGATWTFAGYDKEKSLCERQTDFPWEAGYPTQIQNIYSPNLLILGVPLVTLFLGMLPNDEVSYKAGGHHCSQNNLLKNQ